jgi:hypothetical protein
MVACQYEAVNGFSVPTALHDCAPAHGVLCWQCISADVHLDAYSVVAMLSLYWCVHAYSACAIRVLDLQTMVMAAGIVAVAGT